MGAWPHLSKAPHGKILVVTVHTNDVQFLELQHRLLNKHLKVEFDFAVGFDEPEVEIYRLGQKDTAGKVREYAGVHNLTFVDVPKSAHYQRNDLFFKSDLAKKFDPLHAAIRCADSVQYMLSVLPWQKYSEVLFIDADMFPIKNIEKVPVNFGTPFRGVHQMRKRKKRVIEYLWNGIFWISGDAPFQHLINFDLISSGFLKTDVGGQTSVWIKCLQQVGRPGAFMKHLASNDWGRSGALESGLSDDQIHWLENDYRNDSSGKYFSELYDGTFFHYRAGGNWQERDPEIDLKNRSALVELLTR